MIEMPIADGDMLIRKSLHTFHAGDVDAELQWIASTFVMCVHAASFAEVVLRNHGAPLVQRQRVLAFCDFEVGRRDARHDIALATA